MDIESLYRSWKESLTKSAEQLKKENDGMAIECETKAMKENSIITALKQARHKDEQKVVITIFGSESENKNEKSN